MINSLWVIPVFLCGYVLGRLIKMDKVVHTQSYTSVGEDNVIIQSGSHTYVNGKKIK